MVFFNNPHAARAILESKHDQLHREVATKRAPLTSDAHEATVAPLPQTEPAVQAAAA